MVLPRHPWAPPFRKRRSTTKRVETQSPDKIRIAFRLQRVFARRRNEFYVMRIGADLNSTMTGGLQILTINTGSSSLKVTVSEVVVSRSNLAAPAASETGLVENRVLTGLVERIGGSGCRLRLKDACGTTLVERECDARDHGDALKAVLGGLDTLIFTGRIGERAGSIRRRICEGFEFAGIRLDAQSNEANAPVISIPRHDTRQEGSLVTVRVMQTDEDLMIARHTRSLIRSAAGNCR